MQLEAKSKRHATGYQQHLLWIVKDELSSQGIEGAH